MTSVVVNLSYIQPPTFGSHLDTKTTCAYSHALNTAMPVADTSPPSELTVRFPLCTFAGLDEPVE